MEVVAQIVDSGELNLESRVEVLVVSLEVGVRLRVRCSCRRRGEQRDRRFFGCLLVCSLLLPKLALPANTRKVILVEFADLLSGKGLPVHPARPRHTRGVIGCAQRRRTGRAIRTGGEQGPNARRRRSHKLDLGPPRSGVAPIAGSSSEVGR
eukprot:5414095-Prymnesium_polylepis.1